MGISSKNTKLGITSSILPQMIKNGFGVYSTTHFLRNSFYESTLFSPKFLGVKISKSFIFLDFNPDGGDEYQK